MQHALIVDDSKTASYALRQMLQRLHFQVDTTDSAEAALDYLKECRPQLIFMDHMMPGMDGFDAVKVIKADPATAEIPIVMYTAKEGDVYVGQARALGAADILTKPARDEELQQVLQRLRHQQQAKAAPRPAATVLAAAADSVDSAISYQRPDSEPVRLAALPVRHSDEGGSSLLLPVLLVLLLLASVVLAVMNIQQRQANEAQRAAFAEMLAASFSRNGGYAWNEIPFNDRRLDQVQTLVDQLRTLGFRGTLILESRVGDFCLLSQRRAGGRISRQLPPDDMPITACSELGQEEYRALELAGQQSPAFRNYVATLKNDPDITLQLVPLGSARPLRSYPAAGEFALAADWNAVAAANQTVTFSLLPR